MHNEASAKRESPGSNVAPDWISSCEAVREVIDAYTSNDFCRHANDHFHRLSVRESAEAAIIRRLVQGTLRSRTNCFDYRVRDNSVSLEKETGIIPKPFWVHFDAYGHGRLADWTAGDFSFTTDPSAFYPDVEGLAHGVQFDRRCLPGIQIYHAPATTASPATKGRTGAPRKWDWDGALLHLAAVAHHDPNGLLREDGTDPNQSDIARLLEEWFIGTTGNSPELSQLRGRGKMFVSALNLLKYNDTKKSSLAG